MGEGFRTRRMRFIAAAIMCVLPLLGASPAELEHARKLYRYTDYSGSLQVLAAIQPKDGPVYALTGQNLYMQGEYKKATESQTKENTNNGCNSSVRLLRCQDCISFVMVCFYRLKVAKRDRRRELLR